jgi:hypothetical protein
MDAIQHFLGQMTKCRVLQNEAGVGQMTKKQEMRRGRAGPQRLHGPQAGGRRRFAVAVPRPQLCIGEP